ncbi:ATP-dependent nuclease [Pediococcus pentosaceus]|uniref:ATP-dependent nuclease n=1 Tax=Pediococcus pentosaceus TaxID=1255 RepID=UPI00237F7080|nr:AAA family ATPase [Pediococcus pentosaceus]MDE3750537.1 AAA family ATPase [Pediococcus pentosaceus]
MFNLSIENIRIRNFRAIKDSNIHLEKETIVVGKNNIGKTSLFEIFSAIRKPKLSDFNIELLKKIWDNRKNLGSLNKEDCLELDFTYKWEDLPQDYWILLSDICDRGETRIIFRYSIDSENFESVEKINSVKEIEDFFTRKVYIGSLEDFDNGNEKLVTSKTTIGKLLPNSISNVDYVKNNKGMLLYPITAFRHIDSISNGNEGATANQFMNTVSTLLDNNREVLDDIQKTVDEKLTPSMEELQNDLKKFSYPDDENNPLRATLTIDEWLNKPQIRITQKFKDLEGFELPLRAQGLGYQNIYNIIARVNNLFYKMIEVDCRVPVFIVIEEPEAFTHPQLQHIFIQKINEYIKKLARSSNIKVQLLIISHSSEIASTALKLKYHTIIGREIKGNTYFINWKSENDDEEEKKSKENLKKLILNYNAEVFFADKIIAIEGMSEELIISKMMDKIDPSLISEKIAIIPVGTHFKSYEKALSLLGFEKILLITDLDFAKNWKGDIGNEGCETTNSNLTYLFKEDKELKDILKCIFEQEKDFYTNELELSEKVDGVNFKIVTQGYTEAFRKFIPRTLEAAMIAASKKNFELYKGTNLLRDQVTEIDIDNCHGEKSINNIDKVLLKSTVKKADFAIETLNVAESSDFVIPQYINKGLEWLLKNE